MDARHSLALLKQNVRITQRRVQMRFRLGSGETPSHAPGDPITIIGLFSGQSGLAEAGRLMAHGLSDLGFDVHRIDARPILSGAPDANSNAPDHGPIIVHLNPIEGAEVLARLRLPELSRRLRIGVWLSELDRAPESWARYGAHYHAIWTPSEWSAQSLSHCGVDPVFVPYRHKSPLVTTPPSHTEPAATFHVLAMADYRSSLTRKNIAGAIRVFQAAFPIGDDHRVRLTLKVSHAPSDWAERHLGQNGWFDDTRIDRLERGLAASDVHALMRSADLLLSLHRAEGYGLTLAEALLIGTPVIATDEPAARAFNTCEGLHLVPAQPIDCRDDFGIYAPNSGQWWEPDDQAAIDQLRRAYENWDAQSPKEATTARTARTASAAEALSGADRLDPMRHALAALGVQAI